MEKEEQIYRDVISCGARLRCGGSAILFFALVGLLFHLKYWSSVSGEEELLSWMRLTLLVMLALGVILIMLSRYVTGFAIILNGSHLRLVANMAGRMVCVRRICWEHVHQVGYHYGFDPDSPFSPWGQSEHIIVRGEWDKLSLSPSARLVAFCILCLHGRSLRIRTLPPYFHHQQELVRETCKRAGQAIVDQRALAVSKGKSLHW